MKKLILATALLLAVVLAGCGTTKVVTAGPTADTIEVDGTGTALSKPDRASVQFGVSATDTDPRKAMTAVSAASSKITAALKKAGIADEDLQTGGVELVPQYAYPPGQKPKLTGYQASVFVRAKTKKVDAVGDIIVAGTQAGATNVGGVAFDLSESNPARYSAAENAVADARKRAAAMAKAAGRTLGEVVSMGQPQPADSAKRFLSDYSHGAYAAAAPVLDVQPGQLTAGETVTVVFALK